ncbi:response regulator [Methanocella arvoryzae]|nr:response regulator [Methanocella arvoryzae]
MHPGTYYLSKSHTVVNKRANTKDCVGKYGEKIYLSGAYTSTKTRINNMSDGDDKKPFVAIVDDEPDLQKLYRLAISSRGYPISYIASDGTDALEKQSKANHKPDIVIIDHRMPTKNGVETTKEILATTPATRIIFVSADEAVEKEAIEAGATKFLKKPISLKDLLRNIDEEAKKVSA